MSANINIMNLKISVIIPCYNQSAFLEETLQSVLNQTYLNWECIIVNDGSTDNSEEIAKKWCGYDTRFVYHFKTNGGLSSARNAGLTIATGDLIQFLDGDDLLKPTKFEKQVPDLEIASLSICDYFPFVDGNMELLAENRYLSPFFYETDFKKDIILDWEYRKSIPCHSVLFKKEILKNNNILFCEVLPNHEDWVFWTQLFYVSNKIVNNKDTLVLYRIRNDSMTKDYDLMRQGFIQATEILKTYFRKNNETKLFQAVLKKQNEIYKRYRKPVLKKIKSKIHSILNRFFKYVKNY